MSGLMKQIALATVLVAGSATTASAAVVTNGSFEDGLNGWTVFDSIGTTPGQGIKVITTGGTNSTGFNDNVPNYDGTHAAYFVDDNAIQSLSQFVSLTGGTQYTLNFALFATESGAANPFGFALSDSVGLNLLDINLSSEVPVGVWSEYSYTFTAPITFDYYLLNFSFASGDTPAKDVLLDGVNIAAVPEPTTWAMMIAGMGLVGFTMRRRTAKVQFA